MGFFNAIDTDKDGEIDRKDFCEYYNKQLGKIIEDPRGQLYALERVVNEIRASRGLVTLPSRRSTEIGLVYEKGEKIKMWSASKKDWVDAIVSEAFDSDCFCEGYAVMAGSYKVKTRKTVKWIAPGQVADLMKKA